MARLANISGKDAVNALSKAGWQIRGQSGSHVMMTKTGARATLSVPLHAELSTGLIRLAGMTVEEFLALLQKLPSIACAQTTVAYPRTKCARAYASPR